MGLRASGTALLLFALAPMPLAAATYSIANLGGISVRDINDHGQIVGFDWTVSGHRALMYDKGVVTYLGNLGENNSEAYGINNAGQIVGVTYDVDLQEVGPAGAFIYEGGAMRYIGAPGRSLNWAESISDRGQIVGGHVRPASQTDDELTVLGRDEGRARDVNEAGQVVGSHYPFSGAYRAFLYENGVFKTLGSLGGKLSSAYAINEAGQIVGSSNTRNNVSTHAFLYENGKMKDLGAFGGAGAVSVAWDINNAGEIVGYSQTRVTGYPYTEEHAFLYSKGKMRDLNGLIDPGSGWELTEARAINDLGQIIGSGSYKGQYAAFLLTPFAAVPEPASWVMMIAGLAAAGFAMRRRPVRPMVRTAGLEPALSGRSRF